jgi:heme exporter protein A
MLKVNNLEFDYPEKKLLHGVNFTVAPGTLLHLCGANGAGKTTLLKLLAGILQPFHGEILYDGKPIVDDLPAYLQKICYVGHKSGISPLLTVRENCRFELHQVMGGLSFEELMALFSLGGLEEVPCHLLSVGQRRRVALLRLLMSNADLWLLDEPLVALDSEALSIIMDVMNQHLSRGGLIVLTSHQKLPLSQDNYQEYSV